MVAKIRKVAPVSKVDERLKIKNYKTQHNWLLIKWATHCLCQTDDRKDWRQKEKEVAEGELVRRHHQLNGHELEQTVEETVEDRKLAGYSPWGCKVSDRSQRLNKNKQQQRQVQRVKFLEIGKCYIYSKMNLGWIRENTILLFFLLEIQNNHSFLKKQTTTKKQQKTTKQKPPCTYCVPDTMLAVEDTLADSSNLCPQRAHSIVVRTGFLKEQEMRIHKFLPWPNFSL